MENLKHKGKYCWTLLTSELGLAILERNVDKIGRKSFKVSRGEWGKTGLSGLTENRNYS